MEALEQAVDELEAVRVDSSGDLDADAVAVADAIVNAVAAADDGSPYEAYLAGLRFAVPAPVVIPTPGVARVALHIDPPVTPAGVQPVMVSPPWDQASGSTTTVATPPVNSTGMGSSPPAAAVFDSSPARLVAHRVLQPARGVFDLPPAPLAVVAATTTTPTAVVTPAAAGDATADRVRGSSSSSSSSGASSSQAGGGSSTPSTPGTPGTPAGTQAALVQRTEALKMYLERALGEDVMVDAYFAVHRAMQQNCGNVEEADVGTHFTTTATAGGRERGRERMRETDQHKRRLLKRGNSVMSPRRCCLCFLFSGGHPREKKKIFVASQRIGA
jgi:hypothetical protein